KIISNNNVEQRASYNDKILRVVRGLLVYYGVLSLMELFHLLEKLMPLSLSSFELKELLQEYANYDCAIKCIDSYILLLDVYDEEKIILEQYQRQDLDFYPVNLKMAERAGSLGHEPWNLTQKRFKKYLMQNYDFSSEEAEEILEICVFNIKNDLGIAEQIKFIQNFIEFSDLDEVNEMSRKLSELHNNTRQWVIKGHTPRELFAEEKKHLRSLPNMEEEYARDKDGTIVRTQEKVGRNDPCPCGSGKKYKRCCGR
ncbi:MAG: hypothetical protein PWR10_1049, partial [Halanaerobiales bacterium]|nr:hypothetical protein [Halanaerobiales bacterium]